LFLNPRARARAKDVDRVKKFDNRRFETCFLLKVSAIEILRVIAAIVG